MKVRCSRRVISGLLLVWLGLLQFPLPFAVRAAGATARDKDLSTPFPCMNRACGCQSAEECWSHCCCTTKAERIAFVLEHGLEMPAVLLEDEPPATPPRRCCSKKADCGACQNDAGAHDVSSCEKCQGARKPTRKGLVVLSSALKCKGLTSMLVQFGGAVIPMELPRPELALVTEGLISLIDDLQSGISLSPPAPPPRIAG